MDNPRNMIILVLLSLLVIGVSTGALIAFLQRRHQHRILGILYAANEPLCDTDIIQRGNGALDHKQIYGTLHLLRIEGFIAEFHLQDDFQDGKQVKRYIITDYGRSYADEHLPAPIVG